MASKENLPELSVVVKNGDPSILICALYNLPSSVVTTPDKDVFWAKQLPQSKIKPIKNSL